MANYALGINPLPKVQDGHEFVGDNFLQLLPHTKIFAGVKGLKFRNCNLTNCDLPEDAETDSCRPQHVEWCSHLHPKWVDKGLTECAENCSHVIETDTIQIDGVAVDTVYHYQDRRVG